MNAFKVTYTDGTSYSTSANGTAAEFKAYLCQDGGRIVEENPVTGKETTRWIDTVELLPEEYHITKDTKTNVYTATRSDEKDMISSTNLSYMIERIETKQPKPVITFDDVSRLDFYRSL